MSQSITIKEGDITRGFGHINKLRTSNGSDYDKWVPEDEVDTESLHADKNGLYYTKAYKPSKKEKKKGKKGKCYGYDSVTVSIINQTVGKDINDNPISVGLDDEGNLVETELPVRIEIIKDPTTTNYVDGQDISLEGIQVKAYLADGSEYDTGTEGNIIPVEELSFDPEIAKIAEDGKATSDIEEIQEYLPIGYGKELKYTSEHDSTIRTLTAAGEGGDFICAKLDSSNYAYCLTITASSTPNENLGSSYTYKGKTVYYTTWGHLNYWSIISPLPFIPIAWNIYDRFTPYFAWTMIYGDGGGGQANLVTVSWTPIDGAEELTDTFAITVGQGPIPPND